MLYAGAHNLYVLLVGPRHLLLRLQRDGGEPALAHHQGGAARAKGTATGIYSSAQFLGIFVGGVVGGWANQHGGSAGVFALTAVLALVWLVAAATMKQPSYLTTRLVPIGDGQAGDAEGLAARLRQVPGVAEAVVIAEEKLAYLKVDSKVFDAAMAARAWPARLKRFGSPAPSGSTGLPDTGFLSSPA